MHYEPMPFARIFIRVLFVCFAIAAVGLLLVALTGADGPGVPFTILWLGALTWNAYWWLTRFATDIDVDERELRWRTAIGGGRVRLGDIVASRPMRFASNVQLIELRAGRPVMTLTGRGLKGFLDELARLRPGLPVRLGWRTRMGERIRRGPFR